MKRVIAYVNTIRVHWLVEELRKLGITEIMVTEFFKAISQVSKFAFLCEDNKVESAKELIRTIGTRGSLEDTFIDVLDFDPSTGDRMPVGQRMSVLQKGG